MHQFSDEETKYCNPGKIKAQLIILQISYEGRGREMQLPPNFKQCYGI